MRKNPVTTKSPAEQVREGHSACDGQGIEESAELQSGTNGAVIRLSQRIAAQRNRLQAALNVAAGQHSTVNTLAYRSAVDDPTRFTSSKKVGPWVGLAPSRNRSGERDVSGGITKAGDVNLRRALCQAATVMMHCGRASWLRT